MPRNRKKFKYYTVGVPVDSSLHEALLADSRTTGTSVAKLIPARLQQIYAGGGALTLHKVDELPPAPQVANVEENVAAFLAVGDVD